VVPVLRGKVEECEQSFPVLRQARDRPAILGAVFVGEQLPYRQLHERARCSLEPRHNVTILNHLGAVGGVPVRTGDL
jgi:hypothetical protein